MHRSENRKLKLLIYGKSRHSIDAILQLYSFDVIPNVSLSAVVIYSRHKFNSRQMFCICYFPSQLCNPLFWFACYLCIHNFFITLRSRRVRNCRIVSLVCAIRTTINSNTCRECNANYWLCAARYDRMSVRFANTYKYFTSVLKMRIYE